jgi:hypothetical protein
MSYGCGPAGSRSDFQGISSKRMFEMRNSLKPRSRYEWHSRFARILGRIAPNIEVTRGALGLVVGRPGDTAFHFSMRR